MKVHTRSVFSRGLNVMAQLGLSNGLAPVKDFTPIRSLQGKDIDCIVTSDQTNIAVVNGQSTVLFWGWPLCTRTSYRFLEHYEKVPRLIRGI